MVATNPLPVRAASISEIARIYGLSRSSVRRAIERGELRAGRAGRRRVIVLSDAELWLRVQSRRGKK